MGEEQLIESHRVMWIRTILAMAGTTPQRRAFIGGYNGAALPRHSSEAMREAHELGGQVSALLQGERDAQTPPEDSSHVQ